MLFFACFYVFNVYQDEEEPSKDKLDSRRSSAAIDSRRSSTASTADTERSESRRQSIAEKIAKKVRFVFVFSLGFHCFFSRSLCDNWPMNETHLIKQTKYK